MKYVAFFGVVALVCIGGGLALSRWGGLESGGAAPAVEQDTRPPDAQLAERLAIAVAALRDAAGTRRVLEAQRYARVAIDAIAGPAGRHGRPIAPGTGVLPADADTADIEPGLALRAYDAAPAESPLREAVDGRVTGETAAWRTPRARYDAIDRAVAEYRPDNDTVAALPGESERALAWALLAVRAENIDDAHARAERGARAASRALDAVRLARAAR